MYNRYSIGGGISPYPRDFIIDREGIVRYASTEYEPHTMIGVIQSLVKTTEVDTMASEGIPSRIQLHQNYPNPFNPRTAIRFSLPTAKEITLDILNIRGRRITRLVEGKLEKGRHTVHWGGDNSAGANVASGVYIYRLRTDENSLQRKMILLR